MELVLISLMALFAVLACFVWWRFDIAMSDIVASSVTPAIGIGLIYYYDSMLAWGGGLILLGIGAFALVYLVKRGARPRPPHRTNT